MKAVRIHSYGGRDVLKYEDAPLPELQPSDILVRVHAVSVNPFDWKARQGYLSGYINYPMPLTLGWDVSGEIESMDGKANGFKIGDPVFARTDITRNGGYAEYIAVRAAELEPKPKSLTHIQASAIPNAARAAWNALIMAADLNPGQTVLIHAAAGGVGTFAVQLAKWRGAHIIGTASAKNHEFLAQLGVDQSIDYNTSRFEDTLRDVDVVLDVFGGDIQERSWQVLKPGGFLVSIVQPPSPEKAAAAGVRAAFVTADTGENALKQIASLVDEGRLFPIVSAVFPLDQVDKAHALSESLHARGKIVLEVVPGP